MFSNIGRKIRIFAQFLSIMGIIISIFLGISCITYFADESMTGIGIFLGFTIGIVGSSISYISSFLFIGFGRLVENSDKLVYLAEAKATEQIQGTKASTIHANHPRERKQMTKFEQEVRQSTTDDLRLILQDQQDLYTQEEIETIKEELRKR